LKGSIRRTSNAIFSSFLGVVGGLAVSWFRPGVAPREISNDAPSARPAAPPIWLVDPADDVVARGEISPGAAAKPAPAPSTSSSRRPAPVDLRDTIDPTEEMHEADRLHAQRHDDALLHHQSEPKDPRWAAATEPRIEADLSRVAEKSKFKIVKVDCRMASCVSVLEWPSYADAQHGYATALREIYAVNCGVEILLPPPPNPAARYQADMIFDCESWRADDAAKSGEGN
jgi:hypothetical protein